MKFDLLRGHARAWRICGDAPPPLGRSSPCRNRGPERGARFLRSRLRQPNPRPRDPGCPSGKPLGWRVPSLKWHAPSATAPRYLPSRRDYVVKCARKRAAGPAPARRPLVAIGRVGRGCRDFQGSLRYSHAGVAEWQTRRTQNPLAARPCGFDSLLRHKTLGNVYRYICNRFLRRDQGVPAYHVRRTSFSRCCWRAATHGA
jgi:hypothetical protein